MSGAAIEAHGLSRTFGEGSAKVFAVRNVSMTAHFARMLFIVGPSGSGKTTLLSMLSGILKPSAGQVLVKDIDIWKLRPNRLAEFRLRTIGFVFQDYHLFPRITTLENVAVPLIFQRQPWRKAMSEAKRDLEMVGLGSRMNLSPGKLSGGEQQRVAIARAIAGRPEILIFDEPTASLDGETGRQILGFVKHSLLNEKRCCVVVTHDSRIYEFADEILHMEDGRLVGASDSTPKGG
jgi:putative ABC transport system ATP-binding protein